MAAVEMLRSGTRKSMMLHMGVILFAVATERGGDARMLALVVTDLGMKTPCAVNDRHGF